MEIRNYEINETLARAAKSANSYYEYADNSATNEYYDCLSQFRRAVEELIERNKRGAYPATDEQMELVAYYSDKYAAKLASAINRHNSIEASCPSYMITGGSNFPVRKKQRQNEARDKFWRECGDLFEPTDNYYFKKIKNILTNTTIFSGDALAIEKLQAKLSELEEKQVRMKALNSYYRTHKTLKGFEGISDKKAAELDETIKESYGEQKPYPSWALTNNNAEIRRVKSRIAEIEKLKANAAAVDDEKYPRVDGIEVVENSEAMRIQLIFDEKPDDDTRELLKSNGFRWSPKFGAWQRQLTANGIYATKRVLIKIKEEEK